MRLAFVLCLLPLAFAVDVEPSEVLLQQMRHFGKVLLDQIQDIDFSDVDVPEHSGKDNLLYNTLQSVLRAKLAESGNVHIDQLPMNGSESSPLFVKDGTILGLNETFLQIYNPTAGFDIENLTISIPSLEIFADEYWLNNVDLGVLVLNGNGNLHMKLTGVKLYMKMKIKRLSNIFSVKNIDGFEVDMKESLFELENLGGSGESMSQLLNGIATKVLAKLIRSVNLSLNEILEQAAGVCAQGLELPCAIISCTLNGLICKAILHQDATCAYFEKNCTIGKSTTNANDGYASAARQQSKSTANTDVTTTAAESDVLQTPTSSLLTLLPFASELCKMRLAFVLCLLPLAFAVDVEPSEVLLQQMRHFGKVLLDQIQDIDFSDVDVPEHSGKDNLFYNTLQSVLRAKLAESGNVHIDQLPMNGSESSPLFVKDGTILGLNETFLQIYNPTAGFDIENLTISIPSLEIFADEYWLNNVDLGVLVLNGNGNLHMKLTGVKLYMKMKIKRLSSIFSVKNIDGFEVDMKESLFELENLGGSGESMSQLLNGIATKVLAKLIRSVNLSLNEILEQAAGVCAQGLELPCAIISCTLNGLICKAILHQDATCAYFEKNCKIGTGNLYA